MNLVDAVVTQVISLPYSLYGRWWVDVEYNCYGQTSETNIMCYSEESAKVINVGHTFQI